MIVYRVDDLLPYLTIKVMDGGQVVDLSSLDVYVRWEKPNGTQIPERQALVTAQPTDGLANYVWEPGDLDQPGLFQAIVQLAPKADSTQRFSLTNPPLTQIEVLSNDFQDDTSLPGLPYPSGEEVANVLHMDICDLDSSLLVQSIQRGRTLVYTYAGLFRCPTLVLDPTAQRMARELSAILAAQAYITNPLVIYGPFKKETFGSYSYEMKEGNVVTTKSQTGGPTGNPAADSIISYLTWLCHGCANLSTTEIIYPDWTQPVTTTVPDPAIPVGSRSITGDPTLPTLP